MSESEGKSPGALYRMRAAVSRIVLPNSPSASSVPFVEYLKWYRYTRFTPAWPHSLDIQTRSGCNARCAFCGVGREKNRMHGKMSDELFRRIIDEAMAFPNLRQINPYLLNDPLIDQKIEERIEYITSRREGSRRPLVRIITNAGMLKKERSYRLLRSGLDELNISFNSIIPAVYEGAMKPLKFEKVMGNIEDLLAERDRLGGRGPKISVWTVLTREVEANLENERSFWKRRGVAFKARKLDNRASEEVESAALGGRPLGAVQLCPIPFWRAWIMWNGDMIMCCVDQERTQVLGNCAERSIRETWNDRPYRELRRRWRERDLRGLICRGCKGS